MHRSHFALLSVLALLLTGCAESKGDISSGRGNYISQNPVSVPVSTSKGGKADSSLSSEDTSSVNGDSSLPSKDSTSSSGTGDVDSDWPSNITDLMVQHLGGPSGVIPFMEIGAKKYGGSWLESSYSYSTGNVDAHLEIIGSLAFDPSMITEAKATYEAAGWKVTVSGSTMTATNSELGLKVTLENSNGLPVVKVFYDEPFDPAKGTGWSQATLTTFSNTLNGHTIPYFYPGTINETAKTPSGHSFDIVGGKWDDQIITLAQTAFEGDNADGVNWTVTTSSTTLTATKTFEDGFTITVSVKKDTGSIYSSTYGKAVITVSFGEAFKVPAEADRVWPSDVQTEMMNRFGVVVPYIYLGVTTGITTYWYSFSSELDVRSNGEWNDAVVTYAQQFLEADTSADWDITLNSDSSSSRPLTAIGTIGNKTVTLSIYKGTYGPTLEISVKEAYDKNHTSTDWKAGTKQKFQDNLGGYDFPYVYLGTENENATYSTYSAVLEIKGGTYDNQILTDLTAALNQDNAWGEDWNILSSDASKKSLLAEKLSSDHKKIIMVELSADADGNAILDMSYLEIPDNAAWSTDAQNAFNTSLKGNDIPYLYLNSDSPKVTSSGNTVTLTNDSGLGDPGFELDRAILAAEGWTVSDLTTDQDYYGYSISFTATKELEDGSTLSLTLTYSLIEDDYDYYGYESTTLSISLKEPFKVPTGEDAKWSDDLVSKMEGVLGTGNTIPYIYLGTSTPTWDKNSSEYYYYIKGADWNDMILTEAKKALDNANALYVTVDDDEVCGLVTFEDGTTTWVKVDKDYMGKAEIVFRAFKKATVDNTGAWGKTVTDALTAYFGGYSLPYFDLGDSNPTAEYYYKNRLTFNAPFSMDYLTNAKTILEADGFTVTLEVGDYGPKLVAKKSDENYQYTLLLYGTYDNHIKLELEVDEVFRVPTGADAKWNDTVINVLNNYLWFGDTTNYIPYFYTGTMNPTCSYGSTYQSVEKDFVGGLYDPQVLDLAKAAFEADNTARDAEIQADASKAWTFSYDKTFSSAKNDEGAFVATRKANDGKHTITVRVFKNSDGKAAFWVYYN